MTTQSMKTIILDLLRQSQRDAVEFAQALDETERNAIGTPELWSAKDHLAHMTYCLHQNLIQKVIGVLQQEEVAPREADVNQMNARVFRENQYRPWLEIHANFEQVYADLIKLAERVSEADMMDSERFRIVTGGSPLFTAFLGNGYEHLLEHFMQYYSERQDPSRALQIREQCTNRVVQTDAPAWVKGWFLLRLASIYAQQNQREQAIAHLQEALAFEPDVKEWLEEDPELAALYEQSA
ncbi:tetratricopeptide repeat protein [Ktedonospora formicarum]|uniref:Uncharacterized protein n=1 Tax=Ktedonospora formicarum TaxID=2778364 RepID=A0A8J3MVX2_9CHLR|nr:tetratricopeptide repeat protein [Ktedonospora formicarum]GHO48088.1 hypothetical protein KSX_62510 [Ktedonospora formicarum]